MKIPLLILIVIITLSSTSLFAQADSLSIYFNKAKQEYNTKNYGEFYSNIKKAQRIHPYHQGILYQTGLAAALIGKEQESIEMLRKAINIRATYDLGSPEFGSLKNDTLFQELKQYQKELQKEIIHSDTAFLLNERTLHIETITAGQEKDTYYLGSIHKRKILRSDSKGNVKEFVPPGQDGLTGVFGLKVDSKKNILWACASPVPEIEGYDTTLRSAVFQYDIKTSNLIAKYLPNHSAKEYIFGDVVLNSKGQAFVSDSKNNIIFLVDEKTKQLEPFFTSNEFWNIQGMVFSSNQKYLFISDYIKGIFRLTLSTKQLILLPTDFEISLKSTDGLLIYKNSLITIQNQVVPMRVSRVYLNNKMNRMTRIEIIDSGHPGFNEPTNGCIIGDQLYYVANSQWSGYKDGKMKEREQLQDILILKYTFQANGK